MDDKVFIPVKSDLLFRMFYADERNELFLISLLKSMLMLQDSDYDEIEIADPHLLREFPTDKLAIIDVKLKTATGKIIHIEIQLKITNELKSRIIFYGSKLITEQIGSGQDYDIINKVISIIITDEQLVANSPRYHHRFVFYDADAGVEFTDIIEIHTLELCKLPDGADGSSLYDWAMFIAAESDEELDQVATRNKEVNEAVVKFRELTADERTRDMYERREKARRDQSMLQRHEIRQNKLEIAKKALELNLSVEVIMELTGLSQMEIDNLRKK